jgi:nucleoside-diphosphate-sugar epimerase
MNLAEKRVLVTGGDGFIASHLVRALLAHGARVHITTTSNSFERIGDKVRDIVPHLMRLDQKESITRVVGAVKPQILFHLAATLPRANVSLEEYFATNVIGTITLFEAASKTRELEQFVTTGSSAEYGISKFPITENTQENPIDVYGLSKLLSTKALALAAQKDCTTTILRPCTVFGPTQNPNMFIPKIITTFIKKRAFPLSPALQKLDFLYVDDLVRALIYAACRRKGGNFEIINVGSGKAVSLLSIANEIAEKMNALELLKVGTLPYEPHEPYKRLLTIRKAQKLLSWSPMISLSDGLAQTIASYSTFEARKL